MALPEYKRVVLKLSGEALAGDMGYGIESIRYSIYCRSN